jgi:hypothetical protein
VVVDKALKTLVVRERDAYPGAIRNPEGWTKTVAERLRVEHGARLHQLAHQHPDWSPEQLADTITAPSASNRHVEKPTCGQCNRHTPGFVECPTASPTCPNVFAVEAAR